MPLRGLFSMIRVYGLVRVKVQNVSLRSLEVSDISRMRHVFLGFAGFWGMVVESWDSGVGGLRFRTLGVRGTGTVRCWLKPSVPLRIVLRRAT